VKDRFGRFDPLATKSRNGRYLRIPAEDPRRHPEEVAQRARPRRDGGRGAGSTACAPKLTNLLATLANCPKARSVSVHDRCKRGTSGLREGV
jgi:hypothetical protein